MCNQKFHHVQHVSMCSAEALFEEFNSVNSIMVGCFFLHLMMHVIETCATIVDDAIPAMINANATGDISFSSKFLGAKQ